MGVFKSRNSLRSNVVSNGDCKREVSSANLKCRPNSEFERKFAKLRKLPVTRDTKFATRGKYTALLVECSRHGSWREAILVFEQLLERNLGLYWCRAHGRWHRNVLCQCRHEGHDSRIDQKGLDRGMKLFLGNYKRSRSMTDAQKAAALANFSATTKPRRSKGLRSHCRSSLRVHGH